MLIKAKWSIFSVLFVLALSACSGDDSTPEAEAADLYEVPVQTTDGLTTANAADEGMDVQRLSALMQAVEDGEYTNMHSILIAKSGKLVFEMYKSGFDVFGQAISMGRNTKHRMHSATKSVVSALVGIALEKHNLDLETSLFEHFPEFDFSDDPLKMSITVDDALRMSSGLQWDEWTYSYEDPRNNHERMYESGDWTDYVANRPMESEPGSKFVYNSGLSILLGEFVSNVSRRSLGNFAQSNLLGPLGITNVEWFIGPNDVYQMGGGLSMTSRGLLKFGMLFQNNGMWNDTQVISQEWVQNSTTGKAPNATNYAHHWWVTSYQIGGNIYRAFLAAGRGGQYAVIIPRLELVTVFTAGNDNALASSQPRDMLIRFIIPSVL